MPTAQVIRVLLVDDSPVVRKVVSSFLEADFFLVVGEAADGMEALEKIKELKPDVLVLDLEMPRKDGFGVLEALALRRSDGAKSFSPHPQVVVLSSLVRDDGEIASQCLSLGAHSCLGKPEQGMLHNENLKPRLIQAVKEAFAANGHWVEHLAADRRYLAKTGLIHPLCIMIGSSTGGPTVLEEIIPKLPKTFGLPLVIIQHLPELFTKSFADRLTRMGSLTVVEAKDGDMPRAGLAHIAPGGENIYLRDGKISIERKNIAAYIKPSIDYFFSSAAGAFGKGCVGVVLSGMGGDALKGAQAVHDAGGWMIVQDPKTCVIDAMPKAIIEKGLANEVLSPKEILKKLIDMGSKT
ncbi:MAG TPA: chemotaxis protein CheB [Patescibacteria group bacterium]|nr:chemotaxis protein CheB [Patescibacteria group bacterium]